MEETVMKENKMGVMPIGKLIITMSLPIMISMLVQALILLRDNYVNLNVIGLKMCKIVIYL